MNIFAAGEFFVAQISQICVHIFTQIKILSRHRIFLAYKSPISIWERKVRASGIFFDFELDAFLVELSGHHEEYSFTLIYSLESYQNLKPQYHYIQLLKKIFLLRN